MAPLADLALLPTRRGTRRVEHVRLIVFRLLRMKAAEPLPVTYGRASRRSTAAAAAGRRGGPRIGGADAGRNAALGFQKDE